MLCLPRSPRNLLALFLSVIIVGACKTAPQQSSQTNTPKDAAENIDPSILDRLKNERWTGDVDGLLERRYIRALVLITKRISSTTARNLVASHIMENYFKDAQMNLINRGLFAFASYNAGPNRIAKLRKQAEAEGLNPNLWFNNVELIAAKEIGAETVTYVSNIYKYYIAYQMVAERKS